ncbi:DUF1513 domain-containing protein [Pseudotabrizicola sp. L79]|uniref:DUF1513 domain-containing protein n=1 Tax=Pseudotabrizicola sp. L79 TaxID=3118402 RepID=UPI002F936CBB
MTTRRGFLATLVAATAAPTLTWADAGSPRFLAAAQEPTGSFALFGLTSQGKETFRIALPARGHAGAGHPKRPQAVTFARRPGTYALVIDCARGRVTQTLAAPNGYHFSGHGAFSADGDTLFTGEVDNSTGAGWIGKWSQSEGYRRIGSFPSGGIGPHEIVRLPDGHLAVANGGIIAALDDERTKLNIDTMRPNLSYLAPDGTLVDQIELPQDLHQNSIRHLATRPDGTVAFAMQWEGDSALHPPLLGLHMRGEIPALCDTPAPLAPRMRQYVGSVAFDAGGQQIAITCPKGGVVALFDHKGQFTDMATRADVCGIGPVPGGFVVTDGFGGILELGTDGQRPLALFDRTWDNHLVLV